MSISVEDANPYRVICDTCDYDRDFRTLQGAQTAADLHEISLRMHDCTVWLNVTKQPVKEADK
jgi:hypothetical protein